MFDPGRLFAARLWWAAPWRSDEALDQQDAEYSGPEGRGSAFGVVLGLIIALVFWAAVALLVF
jgi:hypothetical protein